MINKLKSSSKRLLVKLRQFFSRRIKVKIHEDNFISNDFGFGRGDPVDRFYINSFLMNHERLINGLCLEFGDSEYIDKYGASTSEKNIFNYSKQSSIKNNIIMGDLTKLDTLDRDKYDCIICTNVLNFIFDLPNAMLGLKKLLKPKGKILLTVAGVAAHVSRYDMDRWGDFWRMTDKSLIRLAKESGFNIDAIRTYGNPNACSAQLNGLSVQDLNQDDLNAVHNDYQLLVACVLSK